MSIVINTALEASERKLSWATMLKDDKKRRLDVHSASDENNLYEIDRGTIKSYYTIRINGELQMRTNGETVAYFILESAKKYCNRIAFPKLKKIDLEKVPDLNNE